MALGGKSPAEGFGINQVNIVIDVLGGYSKGLRDNVKSLIGEEKCKDVLRRMQKAV